MTYMDFPARVGFRSGYSMSHSLWCDAPEERILLSDSQLRHDSALRCNLFPIICTWFTADT